MKTSILILLVLVAEVMCQLEGDNTDDFLRSIIHKNNNSEQEDPHYRSAAVVHSISIDDQYVFPGTLIDTSGSCFGPKNILIQQGNNLRIVASEPFIAFFRTQTAHNYYILLKQPKGAMDSILLTHMIESQTKGDLQEVVLPLNLTCSFFSRDIPHLKMKGKLHIDFKEKPVQGGIDFNFLLVCANPETVQQFDDIYKFGYVVFWVYCNLVLMVYHGYPRNRSHFVMLLAYIFSSVMLEDRTTAYIVAGILFFVVLIRHKKDNQINNRILGLYSIFLMFVLLLIILSAESSAEGSNWNIFTIALDNFVQTHITMFMVLRLTKLSRLRHVFWYFFAVTLFALLYQGNPNPYFYLTFQNVYNLQCISIDIFFPLMMLPISNYFSSMTWWMHRVIGIAICISCVLPLSWAVNFMGVVIVGILAYEIKKNSIEAIKHRY